MPYFLYTLIFKRLVPYILLLNSSECPSSQLQKKVKQSLVQDAVDGINLVSSKILKPNLSLFILTIMTILTRNVITGIWSEFSYVTRNFCKFNLESTRGHFFFFHVLKYRTS